MAGGEWRKEQLNKLENRFTDQHSSRIDSENLIQSDEDLQPMWKQMESRVANRRPRTLADTGGRTGRRNIKKTEEEMWLQEGLYDDHENENEKQG